MSKKIVKKAGRPPAPIQDYLTKIIPKLQLGYKLPKACKLARVPYSTVLDYYNADENIRAEIDINLEDGNIHARARLKGKATEGEYDHKATMDWLKNMDEDFAEKPMIQADTIKFELTRGEDEDKHILPN